MLSVQFRSTSRRHQREGFLLPLIDSFGADIERAGRGRGRAALASQAQRLGAKGGGVAPTFSRLRGVFHDNRKIRPYSVQNYPTTSVRGGTESRAQCTRQVATLAECLSRYMGNNQANIWWSVGRAICKLGR